MNARRWAPRLAPRCQRGASSVEFFVTFAVAILMIMAILQMGMFMVAKNAVNLATFAAARAGAASGGDHEQMKQAFAKALSGLYVAKGLGLAKGEGLTDITSGNFTVVMAGATAYSYALASAPTDQMTILNPRRAAFADFGVPDPDGKGRIIPATGLAADTAVGASSRQTRADALLLKVEVRHCYEMFFPMYEVISGVVVNAISRTLLQHSGGLSNAERACYTYGVPVVSQAVVRMTAPAVEANFE